jgi:hypothetical protein
MENPDDVVVSVKMGDHTRNLSISKPDHAAVTYELDDKLIGPDGHPYFNKIDAYAADLCLELSKSIHV